MALRIIIPVKPFAEAKRRLSPVLAPDARARLAADFFRHVFATASRFAPPQTIIVISRAPDICALAEAEGATGLVESCAPGLNPALAQAAAFARAGGTTQLLVVASDLPLLQDSDLAAMADGDYAIAPDRHGVGTNALLWPAQPPLPFEFGADSFERHRSIALTAGLAPRIVSRPGLARDVDLPDDLEMSLKRPN